MSIRFLLLRASLVACALTGTAATLAAQITLEASQGARWSNSVTLSQLDSLRFRWKWTGLPHVTYASWQISYASPASATYPPVVKSGKPTVPGENRYGYFQITSDQLPTGTPATFYVRISGPNRYSNWVTITVRQRGRIVAQGGESQAGGGVDQQKEPFIIPGGGGGPKTASYTIVDETKTPLWIRLTQIGCTSPHTEDGDDTDEVYAVIATVKANKNNLANSAVSAAATKVYTFTKCGHADQSPPIVLPVIPAWGPNDGAATPIPQPIEGDASDIAIVVGLLERDNGAPLFILLEMLRTKIRSTLRYPLNYSVGTAMHAVLGGPQSQESKDDWIALGPRPLKLTQEDLNAARAGKVVRKELWFKPEGGYSSSPFGRYVVVLQIGREGEAILGPPIAGCKYGSGPWYGFTKVGACAGRGGVRQWLPEAKALPF